MSFCRGVKQEGKIRSEYLMISIILLILGVGFEVYKHSSNFGGGFFEATSQGGRESDESQMIAKAENLFNEKQYDQSLNLLREIQAGYQLNEQQQKRWNQLLGKIGDARKAQGAAILEKAANSPSHRFYPAEPSARERKLEKQEKQVWNNYLKMKWKDEKMKLRKAKEEEARMNKENCRKTKADLEKRRAWGRQMQENSSGKGYYDAYSNSWVWH